MEKKPAYSKLTPALLDAFLEKFQESLEKEIPTYTFHTGKQGVIKYREHHWRTCGLSEEEVAAKVQYLQDTMIDGLYTVTV